MKFTYHPYTYIVPLRFTNETRNAINKPIINFIQFAIAWYSKVVKID